MLNVAHCCNMLGTLREAVQRKRPEWFNHDVVTLCDTATPHTVRMTKQWFEWYG
jgi:hypothetical protein